MSTQKTCTADAMVLFGALELAAKRGDQAAATKYQRELRKTGWKVTKSPTSTSPRGRSQASRPGR